MPGWNPNWTRRSALVVVPVGPVCPALPMIQVFPAPFLERAAEGVWNLTAVIPHWRGCAKHAPFPSQTPWWHVPSRPEQSSGFPMQTPVAQVSPVVQGSPSSQVPKKGVLEHPVAGMQLSTVQLMLSLQSTVVPTQAPAEQVSLEVHAEPSLQEPSLGV